MKKIAIILLLAPGGFTNNIQAQTKEQTIQWLNAKTGTIPLSIAKYFLLRPNTNDAELMYPQYYNRDVRYIKFSTLTGVAFQKVELGYMIALSGDVKNIIFSENNASIRSSQDYDNAKIGFEKFPFVQITYNVSEEEIKKIKKAYEHLGKECGAKLVDDDFFKN